MSNYEVKKRITLVGFDNPPPRGAIIDAAKDGLALAEFAALEPHGYVAKSNKAATHFGRYHPNYATANMGDAPSNKATFDATQPHADDATLRDILAGTVGEVAESLDGLDADQLARLAHLETAEGQGRKGVADAIAASVAELGE